MTNSWAMLFDHAYGEDKLPPNNNESVGYGTSEDAVFTEELVMSAYESSYGDEEIELDLSDLVDFGCDRVVITDESKPPTGKDATFWKYNEGKILREVEAYLSSTYKGHYVGEQTKIQTLDLIESIGDAEAFCRSNAIKYLSRFGKKEGKNPKDLLKVIHYAFLLYHFSELPFTEDAKETFSPMGR